MQNILENCSFILGSALGILGRPLHVTFEMLRKTYGDIFSLRVANTEVVVINGYDNIKRALIAQAKQFNDRPDITWTHITQGHGMIISPTDNINL